jgi:hypothetical protein
MTPTTADTLQHLADHQSITDLIYRYCRAVDRLDIPLGHSIWHEDGIADYGEGYYQGPGKGVIDLICENHLLMLHHSHQVTNILIELHGDHAGSESYVQVALRLQQQETLQQISVWGRYIDSWSRRENRWGLDKRILVIDFDELRAVTGMAQHGLARRDGSDPSYAVIGNDRV